MSRNCLHAALGVAAAAMLLFPFTASSDTSSAPRPVKVMTRNIYFGADLTRATQAATPQEFLAAVSTIFTNFHKTDFGTRARALAREIEAADPSLIGLQEVALWRRGPVGVLDGPATPADEVVLDFLPVLQAELAARGLAFDVAREQPELDVEAPAGAPYFRDVRLTSRDVILVKRGEVLVHAADSGQFTAAASVPTALGLLQTKSAWASIDASLNKRSLRFVTTHLEPNDPFVRAAQAAELVAPGGPAAPDTRPVVLVGDLNSDPGDSTPDGSTFDTLMSAGFADTWVEANGSAPGFTHGFGELLDDTTTAGFDTRIDHVLTRGSSAPARKAAVTGLDADNRTPSGMWPSDHAGVITTLLP